MAVTIQSRTDHIRDLVCELGGRGVSFWLEGGEVRFRGPDGMDSLPQFNEVKARKEELQSFLAAQARNNSLPPLIPSPRDTIIPGSNAQHAWWILDQIHGVVGHFPTIALTFKGFLSYSCLQRSLEAVVQRHEILRTRWRMTNQGLAQEISPTASVSLEVEDLSSLPSGDWQVEVQTRVEQIWTRAFELEQPPSLRAAVFKIAHNHHVFAVAFHHLAMDAWAMPLFSYALFDAYAAIEAGETPSTAPQGLDYADFALWERTWITGPHLQTNSEQWESRIKALGRLCLPTRSAPDVFSSKLPLYTKKTLAFSVPSDLALACQDFSHAHSAPVPMLLIAGFFLFLSRWTGQMDILVGYLAPGRPAGTQAMLGSFMALKPFYLSISSDPTFLQFVEQVRCAFIQVHDVSNVVAPEIQMIGAMRQAMLYVAQSPAKVDSSLNVGQVLKVQRFEARPGPRNTGHEFEFFLTETPLGIDGNILYAEELFAQEVVAAAPWQFLALLRAAMDGPSRPVGQLVSQDA